MTVTTILILLPLCCRLRRRRGECIYMQVFSLHDYTTEECRDFFRFSAAEIVQLCHLLRIPETMQASNGTKASGLEVLCIVLRKLVYPCRYGDLCPFFHRPKKQICLLFNQGVHFIFDNWSAHLTDFNHPWLTVPSVVMYCEAVRAKGCPLPFCWGFTDGTVRNVRRPIRHQREVFNGHHRVHSLKFQSVVIPNGLIANLFGPMSGRRHDAALLNESGILDHMVTNMIGPDGQPLTVYGDPAYPLTSYVIRPFRGQNLGEEQQAFNTAMSKVRQAVEWEFGKVVRMWAFLDFEKNLKLFLSPVGKLYMVGVLLTNCHTHLRGSETSQYFGLNPPTLEEYLY